MGRGDGKGDGKGGCGGDDNCCAKAQTELGKHSCIAAIINSACEPLNLILTFACGCAAICGEGMILLCCCSIAAAVTNLIGAAINGCCVRDNCGQKTFFSTSTTSAILRFVAGLVGAVALSTWQGEWDDYEACGCVDNSYCREGRRVTPLFPLRSQYIYRRNRPAPRPRTVSILRTTTAAARHT